MLSSRSNKEVRKQQARAKKNTSGVSVEGVDDVSIRFAHCCKPVPGDPIVGYITRGRGITIHHRDCSNIKGIISAEGARIVDAQWDETESGIFQVQVFVIALDRPKITPEVMALINDAKVHITAITSKVKDNKTFMEMSIEISNLDQLNLMLDKIKGIQDVIEVKRTISK